MVRISNGKGKQHIIKLCLDSIVQFYIHSSWTSMKLSWMGLSIITTFDCL